MKTFPQPPLINLWIRTRARAKAHTLRSVVANL